MINGLCIHNGFYAKRRLESVNYELARAIRQHSRFEDVYFSHTYSIAGNPPMLLSISKKPVYKIEDIGGISQRFPRLKREARILLVVQKDDSQKSPGELLAEKAALKEASECFSSDNFAVYHYTGKW